MREELSKEPPAPRAWKVQLDRMLMLSASEAVYMLMFAHAEAEWRGRPSSEA